MNVKIFHVIKNEKNQSDFLLVLIPILRILVILRKKQISSLSYSIIIFCCFRFLGIRNQTSKIRKFKIGMKLLFGFLIRKQVFPLGISIQAAIFCYIPSHAVHHTPILSRTIYCEFFHIFIILLNKLTNK